MVSKNEEVLEFLSSGKAKAEDLVAIREAINEALPVPEIVEDDPPYWDCGDPSKIALGGEEINLLQRGRSQLEQIGKLRDWMNVWARPIMERAGKSKKDDATQELGIDMIIQLLEPDSLLELGCVLIMRDPDFVGEYFDIGWVIDATTRIVQQQPAIKRLTQGFFGRLGS
jgi:hypothetical protein